MSWCQEPSCARRTAATAAACASTPCTDEACSGGTTPAGRDSAGDAPAPDAPVAGAGPTAAGGRSTPSSLRTCGHALRQARSTAGGEACVGARAAQSVLCASCQLHQTLVRDARLWAHLAGRGSPDGGAKGSGTRHGGGHHHWRRHNALRSRRSAPQTRRLSPSLPPRVVFLRDLASPPAQNQRACGEDTEGAWGSDAPRCAGGGAGAAGSPSAPASPPRMMVMCCCCWSPDAVSDSMGLCMRPGARTEDAAANAAAAAAAADAAVELAVDVGGAEAGALPGAAAAGRLPAAAAAATETVARSLTPGKKSSCIALTMAT